MNPKGSISDLEKQMNTETGSSIDIHAQENREQMARLIANLFDKWQLSIEDQGRLLGLTDNAESTLADYRNGAAVADSEDLIGRIGHLLSIYKSLHLAFPYDQDLADRWISGPNKRFGGWSALDIMKQNGLDGIVAVRRYLDSEQER